MSEASAGSRAILLRRVNYRESDLVLTLLCRDKGVVSALARGARRSKRRFGASLQLFSISELELSRRRGGEMWTLQSAQLVRAHMEIASDVAALAHGSYALELVRELAPAEQPDQGLFDLLEAFITSLSEVGPVSARLRRFELSLLDHIGLAPVFDRCAGCSNEPGRGAVFDHDRGGVVCARCAAHSRGVGVRPISEEARSYLARLSRAPHFDDADAVAAGIGRDVAGESRDRMLGLLTHHVGKALRSLQFLTKMSRAPRA